MTKHKLTLRYLVDNLSVVIGLVLIWRGIWYILDGLDDWLFGGTRIWTTIGGIVVGVLILYLPDKDLKEVGKL